MTEKVIVSTAWLGPVEYFAWIAQTEQLIIEDRESYVRQTYRNRCAIATANGRQELPVAVVRSRKNHVPVREARISYDIPWNVLHWRSIEAAYNNSPFFLYYRDAIEPFFRNRYEFVADLNDALLKVLLDILKIKPEVSYTTGYFREYPGIPDLRYRIVPDKTKPRRPTVQMAPYSQVFDQHNGFIPNLSIIDLIFNRGPEARSYLLNCKTEL